MFFEILIISLFFSCLYFIHKLYLIGLNIVSLLKKINNISISNTLIPIGKTDNYYLSEDELFDDDDFTLPIIRDDFSFGI